MIKQWCVLVVGLALATSAVADGNSAEIGKTYEVTVTTETGNHFTGSFGEGRIGDVVVLVAEGKVGDKFSVTVTAIKLNGFTGMQQASCTFRQIGGERDGREGQCNPSPGG